MERTAPISGRWGSAALWFGLLAPIVAWGLRLVVSYGIEEIVCSKGSTAFDVLGFPVRATILVECVALLALSVAGGVVAERARRRADRQGSAERRVRDGAAERMAWMALAGVFSSVLFSLLIVLESVPVLLLPLCEATL